MLDTKNSVVPVKVLSLVWNSQSLLYPSIYILPVSLEEDDAISTANASFKPYIPVKVLGVLLILPAVKLLNSLLISNNFWLEYLFKVKFKGVSVDKTILWVSTSVLPVFLEYWFNVVTPIFTKLITPTFISLVWPNILDKLGSLVALTTLNVHQNF